MGSTDTPACPLADAWLNDLGRHRGEDDVARIRAAIAEAQRIHGEERIHGQPRLQQLLETACILDGLKLDADSLIAGLLVESLDHENFDQQRILDRFGSPVADMLRDLRRITVLTVAATQTPGSRQLENLRRMLLSLADDVRIIVIVLARRLQKLRVLKHYPSGLQRDIARETLQIHAPLANRLGIWQLKWELEDLAFRYTDPDTYQRLARELESKRQQREAFIAEFIDSLRAKCTAEGIEAAISGRPKHIYSIWKKMQRKQVDFAQIYDVRAVRVQVATVAECYQVLGIVHGNWRPVPGEFDDYIARPKANGYRSLHTAVIGDDGIAMEVQVRTAEMHEHSERGVAAHWRYKENSGRDQDLERRIEWMRNWLEDMDGGAEPDPEFEARTIYVLTPQGKVVELPTGATAVDFAYAIHTSVGHRCRGARADGRIIPLSRPLHSGQTVEIITTREGGPSRDWLTPGLHYVVTARARTQIRQWFKKQDHRQHVQMGRAALERETSRLSLGKIDLEPLLEGFGFHAVDDLLAAIGRGELSPLQVANSQRICEPRDAEREIPERARLRNRHHGAVSGGEILVDGVGDLMTQMARCCKPVPNDPVVGYITRGRGVTVHRQNCQMLAKMDERQKQRLIPVSWAELQPSTRYLVDIRIHAADRKGLLRDISSVFSNQDIAVLGVNTQTDRRQEKANMLFSVEITDMNQLSRVLDRLAQVPDVYHVQRQV